MVWDSNALVTVALAGAGAGATATAWAVRAYINAQIAPVSARLNLHETTDAIVHKNVELALADLKVVTNNVDSKVDRLVERFL